MKEMQDVIQTQDMCVLATVMDNMPHCSLMAYITDDEYSKVYMVTHINTKKYSNLLENPSVCLLIDTRLSGTAVPREEVQALTVNGKFEQLENTDEIDRLRQKFMKHHVHLAEFAQDPQAVVFAVRLQSLQLQHGAVDAKYSDVEC